jgi:hypothetical protein
MESPAGVIRPGFFFSHARIEKAALQCLCVQCADNSGEVELLNDHLPQKDPVALPEELSEWVR